LKKCRGKTVEKGKKQRKLLKPRKGGGRGA